VEPLIRRRGLNGDGGELTRRVSIKCVFLMHRGRYFIGRRMIKLLINRMLINL